MPRSKKQEEVTVDLDNPVRHPLSAIFDDLDATDMNELMDSIEEVGVLHPIIVDDQGRILDGFQRIRAVKQLEKVGVKGIELEFQVEENIDGYVWANNMTRRHMSPAERAKAVLKMDDWCQQNIEGYEPRSIRQLAEQSGTSTATVARQRKGDTGEAKEDKPPKRTKEDELEEELLAVRKERDAAREKVVELEERIAMMTESNKTKQFGDNLKKFIQLQTKNRTLTDTNNTQRARINDLEKQLKGAKSQLKKGK